MSILHAMHHVIRVLAFRRQRKTNAYHRSQYVSHQRLQLHIRHPELQSLVLFARPRKYGLEMVSASQGFLETGLGLSSLFPNILLSAVLPTQVAMKREDYLI